MSSSRRQPQEMEFGSDSFMDIVANVVGILIILIVLAGIKVGQYVTEQVNQPPDMTIPVTPEIKAVPYAPSAVAQRLSVPQPGRLVQQITVDPDYQPSSTQLVFQPPVTVGSFPDPSLPEQEQAANQLKVQLQKLKLLANDRKNLFPELQNEYAKLDKTQSEINQLLAEQKMLGSNMLEDSKAKEENQQALSMQLEEFTKQAEIVTNDINRLSKEILDKEAKKPLPQTLEHKITPVGKYVDNKELHFRIKHQKIAYLPIDELTEDLKRRIYKNRQALMQTFNLEGTVGPVSGFSMKYSVSLQNAPVADQLRGGGSNLVRIGVDGWEIVPEKDDMGETEKQAFQRGSLYDTYLANAGRGTTLTIWVYTDSFAMARRIQAHAQQLGYKVAARPLPEDVPIVGSPSGSKSFAQ